MRAPGFRVDTIETTGAGDCFMGCCLGYILDHGLQGLDEAGLAHMLRFANAAAALVTTKKGRHPLHARAGGDPAADGREIKKERGPADHSPGRRAWLS